MITHTQYILASSSSSRKKILENCGFNFIQIKPICNEEQIKKKLKKQKHQAQLLKFYHTKRQKV